MIIKEGNAKRIIFFQKGEEGTYVDNVKVRLHDTGVVEFNNDEGDSAVHISNCEVLWNYPEPVSYGNTHTGNVTSITRKRV